MVRIEHIIQLIVSLALIGLFWMIYPGVMVFAASALGLVYVAASIGAIRGSLLGGRVAFAFSAMTAILATLAVLRFVGNSFSYLSGSFESHDGVYWVPYAFLAVATGATLVVVLQLYSWRAGSGGEAQS
jgi:hypothetical protein